MRLGVSPDAAPTPMGVFNQRFEALFPQAGALGCWSTVLPSVHPGLSVCECGATLPAPFSATLSLALSVYLCKCGASGPASAQTACAICPTLRQSQSPPQPRKSSPPRCPSPPLLPVWIFSISLVLVPLAVRFSVSSGCARRRSVSTYAAILVLPVKYIKKKKI